MSRRLTSGVAIAVALGALSACGTGDGVDPAASSPSATTSADASPGSASPGSGAAGESGSVGSSGPDGSVSPAPEEAAFPADTSPDTGAASADAHLVLVDVRSAAHDQYDRVVLEFSGTGTPGWTAQYAPSAARQGSGEQISVDGSALLDINITGSAIPMAGDPTVTAGPVTPSGTSAVTGIFNDGTFEGTTHVVLGTDGEKPFRVFAAADPPRVVIDVQN